MENTSYGINVANRYDLFCIDDDAGDPIEAILKNKQKQQKKQQAAAAAASATPAAPQAAAGGAQPPSSGQAKSSNVKGGGEKENKSAGGRGAENRHPDKSAVQTNGTGNLHNQQRGGTERRGIKETQKDNIRNQENQRGAGGNQGAGKFPRGNGPNQKPGGTVAFGGGNDDKYPRKPREFDDGQRKPYVQNGGAAGAGGPKRFDGRGKRELDRQSGSNKTGIKAVDKRDGAGSHNWGSSKQDAKEFLQDQDYQPQDADTSADEKTNAERTNVANGGEGGEGGDGGANAKSEDEAKEMTLDEWKAQKAAVRLKPQYNLRKAGEGEDAAQWDKMVALDRKSVKDGSAVDGGEEDESNDTQKAASGGKGGKQVLEIEFHFNDSRRGGLGRGRGGRGAKGGGRGMGRDGPAGGGGRRGDFGGDNYRSGGGGGDYSFHYQEGAAGIGGLYEGGLERPQRDNMRRTNRPPYGGGGGGGGGGSERHYEGGVNKYSRPNPRASKQQHVPAAPKVDDEHDFPSLG